VKGLLDPVAAYRPRLSTRPIHQEQQNRPSGGKIIGRVSEVDLLRKCLVDLKRGQLSEANRLVVIEGVEGTGKSLLLANLLELAQQLRMTILYGAGHALEKATPYYAWRPIFREIFGVKTLFDDIVALRAHVFGQLPPIRGERGYPAFAIRLSPFLNDVLPLNLPENTTTKAMSPGERRRMTRFFLLRLLQRTIQGAKGRKAHPTLLVLDNGQWMDDLSWELVESVGNMVDSAVMVVATRPIFEQVTVGTVSSTCRRLKDSSRGTWLQMPALTESETIELICHRLGVNSLSEEVLGELRAKAKGHPLFSEDLIRSWLKEGLVTVDSGECRLTDHGSLSGEILPPDQVHGAIIGRLERLEPEHQLVLKVASVLDPSFTIGELERIYPDVPDKQKLATNLNLLVRFGLLKHTLSHSTTTYAFSYALLREVACSLLPFTTRQDLRNMIAS
jgi:predicted ATPase